MVSGLFMDSFTFSFEGYRDIARRERNPGRRLHQAPPMGIGAPIIKMNVDFLTHIAE